MVSKKGPPSLSRQLNLYLPKFSIDGTYKLEKILPKLGIQDIFTTDADLSGLTDHPNIKLSEVSLEAPEHLISEVTIPSLLTPHYPYPTTHYPAPALPLDPISL